MREAISLSQEGMDKNEGGPFGCVIVQGDQIIGRGNNKVTSSCDPTAHAEIVAIREACHAVNSFDLTGCELYTSCEPCPMCLSAIYWARISRIYYACSRKDAAAIGFDDDFLYAEIPKPLHERMVPINQFLHEEGMVVFQHWMDKPDKIDY